MERNASELLLQQIRSCTNLIHRLMHSEHHCGNHGGMEGGIGRGQGLVLRILAEQDGLAQSELAEELDIRPSSLGELVTKLEEGGLIERRRNEENKRVVNVFLTEKGRGTEKELSDPRRQAAETWCAGLSDEEKEQLAVLLKKLIDSMDAALAKNGGEFAGREESYGCRGGGWGGHGSHGCGGHGHPDGGPEGHHGCGGHGHPDGGPEGRHGCGGHGHPDGGPEGHHGCGGHGHPDGGPEGRHGCGGHGHPDGGPEGHHGCGRRGHSGENSEGRGFEGRSGEHRRGGWEG